MTSFVSAPVVIGFLGLLLLQSPSRSHLLDFAFLDGLLTGSALSQSDRPWVDPPIWRNEPAQAPQAAPADGAQPGPGAPRPAHGQAASPSVTTSTAHVPAPAPPKTSPSKSAALVPVHSARPPEPAPPHASPSGRIAPDLARGEAAGFARELALAYLDYWSAPNAVTL